jgi:hypothetical protein
MSTQIIYDLRRLIRLQVNKICVYLLNPRHLRAKKEIQNASNK